MGKFVVMHSGNVGHAQNLDALVRATTFLRDLEDLAVVIIGFGARYNEIVGLAELLEADKVHFLPYQARSVLAQSLSAADVHYVGLVAGLSGYVVPSRLYGILATARPVIAAADPESETAHVVSTAGCGVVVPPGRPELVAAAIRDAHDGRYDLELMGSHARKYAIAEADRLEIAQAKRLEHLAIRLGRADPLHQLLHVQVAEEERLLGGDLGTRRLKARVARQRLARRPLQYRQHVLAFEIRAAKHFDPVGEATFAVFKFGGANEEGGFADFELVLF
jgi:hypothetical protein